MLTKQSKPSLFPLNPSESASEQIERGFGWIASMLRAFGSEAIPSGGRKSRFWPREV